LPATDFDGCDVHVIILVSISVGKSILVLQLVSEVWIYTRMS